MVVVERTACRTPEATGCVRITAELRSGPDEGSLTQLTLGDQGTRPDVDVGDDLRLYRNVLPEGAVIGGAPVDAYTLADFERRAPLAWLALAFALGFGGLFRSALSVGHDHIAATVNTLVLAYAGASLPVLLIFSLGDVSLGDAVNSEAVAEQIVAMLVGSIGLIAAVPITTALAAALVLRLEPSQLEAHAH